ncbi:NADPH-dependent 1-acyldihydroxyacetone phosphate reductase [Penicillium subrubescens]|uniref:NADPH-dependent 1-acyldihydroxyacetone phosphate reductase n=1 Tax=Penicillium subrubescens TaxID=1316194 RepID=A0A1Q5UCF7_9EURO|nr:NADPH-dependent 1-acyldihydroxyacetone phosphate reductase [Penicillium subrubescens]
MMNRDRLTSYFKAELYAQVNRKPLDGWEEVPFFRLGRAGTHYPDGSAGVFVPRFQRWGTVEDPLSLVTADLRKQLEGDWFDLQDLEGYLRDKNVLLVLSGGEPTRRSEGQININVSRLISDKFQVAAQALHHHQNTFHRENGSETILITGCSEGGIGDALAKTFHKKSLRVFASALNTAKVQHLKDMGLEIVQLDVTDKESIKKAVSTVKAATGGYLDIPVNNSSAGSLTPSKQFFSQIVSKY